MSAQIDSERNLKLAALHAENLRLTQALEQARSDLQRITFTVMHDLRAPLRHIGAFVKVIGEDHGRALEAPVLTHLKVIEDAAASAMTILDTLAAFRRP